MTYSPKDFSPLLGTTGFSDDLLKAHFKLYEGYVTNTNKLIEKLESLEKGTPEYNELKRRFGWEWNGMRLHELYFGNMSKDGGETNDQNDVYKKISDQFGSFDDWAEDFKKTGAMRGIGWVVFYYDKNHNKARINADEKDADNADTGRLFNVWINEHDVGHLAGATPLLVMDVFEHAFVLDYGMDRGAYIEAFMNAVDWEEVDTRFTSA